MSKASKKMGKAGKLFEKVKEKADEQGFTEILKEKALEKFIEGGLLG